MRAFPRSTRDDDEVEIPLLQNHSPKITDDCLTPSSLLQHVCILCSAFFLLSATASRGANKRSLAFDALSLSYYARAHISLLFHIPSLALSLTRRGLKRGPLQ